MASLAVVKQPLDMSTLDNIFNHDACPNNEVLGQYVQGLLPKAQAHAIEAHAVDCPFCSDAMDGLKMIPTDKIDAINHNLQQAINSRVQRKPKVFLIHPAAWAAVAAMLLIVASIFIFDVFKPQPLAVNERAGNIDTLLNQTTVTADKPANTTDTVKTVSTVPSPTQKRHNNTMAKNENSIVMDASVNDTFTDIHRESDDETNAEVVSAPAIAKYEAISELKDSEQEGVKVTEDTKNHVDVVNSNKRQSVAAASKQSIVAPFNYDRYDTALALYYSGKYNDAITQLDSILRADKNNTNANFYTGMCYYRLTNYAIAVTYLDKAASSKKSVLFEDALFYKALSLKETGNLSEAKSLMQRVVKLNSTHQEKAKQYLKTWK
jgi:TolA-binding protein